MALQEQPAVNAYMDIENKQIVYHDYVAISVAVASKKGLVGVSSPLLPLLFFFCALLVFCVDCFAHVVF